MSDRRKIGVQVIIIIRRHRFPLIAGHPRNNTVALSADLRVPA